MDACLDCHDDEHSRNFRNSSHFNRWQSSPAVPGLSSQGASCATCHMPRVEIVEGGESRISSLHNQNETLRPNEKMVRPTCLHCHGLGFSLDALADPELIRNNFSGPSKVHVESVEMVARRILELSR